MFDVVYAGRVYFTGTYVECRDWMQNRALLVGRPYRIIPHGT